MSQVFLETILPANGRYCAVAIDDKSKGIKRQVFTNTIEELVELVESFDTAGLGSFFALANYGEQDRRLADNAQSMRSLFIDVDCGEGKPYADPTAAASALRAFIDATKLPRPSVVASGGGLHAYWPFTEDLPVSEWKPMARALKKLCVDQKFSVDLQCTTDAARVLRCPGTSNYKQDKPRPVNVIYLGTPSTPEALRALLPMSELPADLSAAKQFGADDATKALAVGTRRPSKFSIILAKSMAGDGCGQIRNAMETQKRIEEPLWRAALSIAWNCEDAEEAIVTISKDHPEYTYEKTLDKSQRLTDKPYTCSWYKENHPTHCEGCQQRITSPIQLGGYMPEAEADPEGGYVIETEVGADVDGANPIVVKAYMPELPKPYFRGVQGGIYLRKVDDSGVEIEPIEIYPQDLYVTERFYDSPEHGDGEGELVAINLHLPRDGLRQFHAPVYHLLAKDKLRDLLVKHGVVAYGKQLDNIMAYLASSIRKLQASFSSSKTRNQMGWTPENHFVIGEFEYTPAGVRLAPPASNTRQLAPLFHSKGTVEGWRDIINFYNRPGMEGHAFGFLVGLGSCLLKLLNNTQVRGAVLNLVSNGSGTGKTTVQLAINSIFGHPTELLMEAKDTPASRFQRLGTLNSICMTVDELTNASGEQLSALVYGSTSGRAPHRMEASANKLRTNQTTWCSVTVTSSNAVMADALAAHRTAVEGELKRVIDLHISVPPDIPKSESDALFSRLAHNYGVAGPKFIEFVVCNRELVERTLHDMQLSIDKEANFERNDRFYSAVCTLAIVAGLIGNKLELFKLNISRIREFALKQVSEVKESNQSTVGDAGTMALETLSRFINENVNNVLIVHKGTAGTPAPSTSPKGQLKMRYEADTGEIIIPASDLRTYFVDRRVDFRASLLEFKAKNLLALGPKNELSVVRRVAAGAVGSMSAPAVRCYVFKNAKLGANIPVPEDAPAR